jgi:Tfp pilus assembly protein PilF
MSGVNVTPEHLARTSAAEARTLHELNERHWAEAFTNARIWLDDQFFSAKAAIVASYTSAVGLMDWQTSYGTARLGLLVHPKDITLLNNAAYALTEMDRFSEAHVLLSQIPESGLQESAGIAVLATLGLLAFREGDPTRGRQLYRQSIALAHRMERSAETHARLMLAREEMRIRSDSWEATLTEAIQMASTPSDVGAAAWLERLLALAEELPRDQ